MEAWSGGQAQKLVVTVTLEELYWSVTRSRTRRQRHLTDLSHAFAKTVFIYSMLDVISFDTGPR